jgi:hypothetical protein
MWVSTEVSTCGTGNFLPSQLLDMGTLTIDANYLLAGHAGGKDYLELFWINSDRRISGRSKQSQSQS